jgi:hypothetical protein
MALFLGASCFVSQRSCFVSFKVFFAVWKVLLKRVIVHTIVGIHFTQPAAFYAYASTTYAQPAIRYLSSQQPAYSYSQSAMPVNSTCIVPASVHTKTLANIQATGSFILPEVSCFNLQQVGNAFSESHERCRKEYVLTDYEAQNMGKITDNIAESRIYRHTSPCDQGCTTMLDLEHQMRLDSATQKKMLILLSARLDEIVSINDRRQVPN